MYVDRWLKSGLAPWPVDRSRPIDRDSASGNALDLFGYIEIGNHQMCGVLVLPKKGQKKR